MDLLFCVKRLAIALHHENGDHYDTLILGFVLRLLKSSQFGARMLGLKELSKILEDILRSTQFSTTTVPAHAVRTWLTQNNVLALVMEGKIYVGTNLMSNV